MIFSKEAWQRAVEGYTPYDCAFRSPIRQVFVLKEDQDKPDPLPRTRILFTYNDKLEINERFYGKGFNDLETTRIASGVGMAEVVVIDVGGQVYSYDANRDSLEDKLPLDLPGTDLTAAFSNIVRIGGSIYAVGGPRRLYRRAAINQWQDITADMPIPEGFIEEDAPTIIGTRWEDASGFSESDIYVTGGFGDVWIFDGHEWAQCDFPSNEWLHNICCAGDGKVYIGGNLGSLWVGLRDNWRNISTEKFNMPWKDIAWFKGRLILGSDYGLWELKDDSIQRLEAPADVHFCSGSLDVSHDGNYLLTAGGHGACLYDGNEWSILFNGMEFEKNG